MPILGALPRPRTLGIIAILAGTFAGAAFVWLAQSSPGEREMIGALPKTAATLVYIDAATLRKAGYLDLIAGARGAEDPEYKRFVAATGFDYRRDIDRIAGSFLAGDAFFAVSGRFDWAKLDQYAVAQGGKCRDGVCRAPTGTPGRFASFYPLGRNTLAIAFSTNETAALDIAPRKDAPATEYPRDPVWAVVPAAALHDAKVPAGAQSFTSPLQLAERIALSAGPKDGQLQLKLDVTASSPAAASDLLVKLEGATNTLRKLIEREHMQPNPNDFSGLLTSGSFRREDAKVYGVWPLRKEFIESVAAGALAEDSKRK